MYYITIYNARRRGQTELFILNEWQCEGRDDGTNKKKSLPRLFGISEIIYETIHLREMVVKKDDYMELACHYTTLEVFWEMLHRIEWNQCPEERTLTFWASSIYSMNDPQEFIYGYELLINTILPDIEKDLNIKDRSLKLSKVASFWKNNSLEESNRIIINHIYNEHKVPFIVSFTKNIDYLPMWNMYSNNGNGVCLCFKNYDYKIKSMDDIGIINYLHATDVSYGEVSEAIKNTIRRLYTKYYKEYQKDDNIIRKKKMLNYFMNLAITISPYHKHKAYAFENEVRLVQFKDSDTDVKHRISKKGKLIPYIEVPIKLNYLDKVIVGPCADSPSIIRELRYVLKRYKGSEDNFIVPSEVPYREY